MNCYTIDYGWSVAKMWSTLEQPEDVLRRFYQLANQCFGIRKCITKDPAILDTKVAALPSWVPPGTAEALEHDGDRIAWDAGGQKIKSEWDSE